MSVADEGALSGIVDRMEDQIADLETRLNDALRAGGLLERNWLSEMNKREALVDGLEAALRDAMAWAATYTPVIPKHQREEMWNDKIKQIKDALTAKAKV